MNRKRHDYFMSFINTRSMQMRVHEMWRKSFVEFLSEKMR